MPALVSFPDHSPNSPHVFTINISTFPNCYSTTYSTMKLFWFIAIWLIASSSSQRPSTNRSFDPIGLLMQLALSREIERQTSQSPPTSTTTTTPTPIRALHAAQCPDVAEKLDEAERRFYELAGLVHQIWNELRHGYPSSTAKSRSSS